MDRRIEMEDPDILEIFLSEEEFENPDRHVQIIETEEEEKEPRRIVILTEAGCPSPPNEGRTAAMVTSMTPTSTPSTSTPTTETSIPRWKRYRSRIQTIYPPKETRHISFIPSDSEEDNEDCDDGGVYINPNDGLKDYHQSHDSRQRYSFPPKSNLPNSVKSYEEIRWQDKLGLEFALNNLPLVNPTIMPEITMQEAKKLIQRDGPYFVGPKQTDLPNVHEFRSDEHISQDLLEDFLVTVRAWRVICLDTESDGKLLYNVQPHKGQPGRILVIFGNPAGQVLIFHDSRKVPIELVRIWADFSYIKIQSNIDHDIRLLTGNGFRYFRGIVDLQTLISLVQPTVSKCGIEECTKYVWTPRPDEELRVQWVKEFNKGYEKERMSVESIRHSVQDVIVPFAIMLRVALDITRYQKITDIYENIFPALNEALELCISKAPADIRNKLAGNLKPLPNDNFINDSCLNWSTPFEFNSHRHVQRIRRARGDLVEKFDTGFTWAQIIERARVSLDLLEGRLPTANEQSYIDLRFHLMDHCSFCGSQKHESASCVELTVPCQYEHGPKVELPPHSILCCPALHCFCSLCKTRGHLEEVHGRGWKSAGELRRIFLESAPFGLYTVLPYLNRDKKNASKILHYHYKMGLAGKRAIYAFSDYWLYGGLKGPTPEELEVGARYRETTKRNLRSRPETYESLKFEKIRVEELNKAKAEGTAPVKKKESGSQRRKRRAAEKAAEAEAERSAKRPKLS